MGIGGTHIRRFVSVIAAGLVGALTMAWAIVSGLVDETLLSVDGIDLAGDRITGENLVLTLDPSAVGLGRGPEASARGPLVVTLDSTRLTGMCLAANEPVVGFGVLGVSIRTGPETVTSVGTVGLNASTLRARGPVVTPAVQVGFAAREAGLDSAAPGSFMLRSAPTRPAGQSPEFELEEVEARVHVLRLNDGIGLSSLRLSLLPQRGESGTRPAGC